MCSVREPEELQERISKCNCALFGSRRHVGLTKMGAIAQRMGVFCVTLEH